MGILKYLKVLYHRLFRNDKELVDVKGAFITFLYMQEAYEDFTEAFNFFNKGEITLDDYLEVTDPLEYIVGAFSWTDSSWSSWSNLNLKWQLFLCKEM